MIISAGHDIKRRGIATVKGGHGLLATPKTESENNVAAIRVPF